MTFQIFIGSLIILLNLTVHAIVLVMTVRPVRRAGDWVRAHERIEGALAAITLGGVIVLAAHTVEVWIWAFALQWTGAVPTLPDAVYFALVTFTTLGYGDIILPPEFRIFAAMAAVNGMVLFGISTAYLVEVYMLAFGRRAGGPGETLRRFRGPRFLGDREADRDDPD